MALAVDALTTLAKLKTQLGISDSSKDTLLEELITQSSAMIVSFVGRKLHYDAAIVESCPGYGTNYITLKRTPLWHCTSVTYDGSTIDSTNYDEDKEAGCLFASAGWQWTVTALAGVGQNSIPGTEKKRFTVTYIGGWVTPNQSLPSPNTYNVETLPADIEGACLALASTLYGRVGRDRDIRSESLIDYSVSYGEPDVSLGGLPAEVAAALNPYRDINQA